MAVEKKAAPVAARMAAAAEAGAGEAGEAAAAAAAALPVNSQIEVENRVL